jgi:LPXTG-motif cell wall-anchored protein
VKIRLAARIATVSAVAAAIVATTSTLASAADGAPPAYGSTTNTGSTLPVTGFPVGTFVIAGLALLLVGTALAITFRRRAERHS